MAAVHTTPHLNEAQYDPSRLDEAELVALYDAHYESLVRLASILLDSREACEDVVQDSFAKYWTLRRRPEASKSGAYLRSMVLNRARTIMRRRQVFRRLPFRPAPEVGDAADQAVLEIQQEEILAALRDLPRRQMEVLVLRFWLDQSSSEIAETLGISIGSVKTHARRGLSALGAENDSKGSSDFDE